MGGVRADDAPVALTVVIPTAGRRAILLETLRRLATGAPAGVEVVVAVDGDRDATAEAVRGFAAGSSLPVEVLVDAHRGIAAARNRALAHARGRSVLFLGDDTWPRPDLLARHLAFHATRPDAAEALLGRVVWAASLAREPFMAWLEESGLQNGYPAAAGPTSGGFFYTGNVSVKRELVVAAGGFDENFPFAAEDIELGLRLEAAGMRLTYDPEAVAEHFHPTDLAGSMRRMDVVGRATARLVAVAPSWPAPRRPGLRHRVKAAALTAPYLARVRPLAIRRTAWLFLCHERYRESFWAPDAPAPRLRVGERLARLAARDPLAHPVAPDAISGGGEPQDDEVASGEDGPPGAGRPDRAAARVGARRIDEHEPDAEPPR
jgi:Glycosyltransferase like family 2